MVAIHHDLYSFIMFHLTASRFNLRMAEFKNFPEGMPPDPIYKNMLCLLCSIAICKLASWAWGNYAGIILRILIGNANLELFHWE